MIVSTWSLTTQMWQMSRVALIEVCDVTSIRSLSASLISLSLYPPLVILKSSCARMKEPSSFPDRKRQASLFNQLVGKKSDEIWTQCWWYNHVHDDNNLFLLHFVELIAFLPCAEVIPEEIQRCWLHKWQGDTSSRTGRWRVNVPQLSNYIF